jgi:hypothetical protein
MSGLEIAVPLATLVLLGGALEVGFRRGYRRRAAEPDAHLTSQVGAIQGAILGLLGLLLAFSFAAAATRFLERQDLIVAEANAIGTAALRAELLAEPYRSELRSALQRYTERRIEVAKSFAVAIDPAVLVEVEQRHGEIWRAAREGVLAQPSLTLAVLVPVNEVIDLHATRVAAARKHLPLPVLGLLFACSALAIAIAGYGCGVDDRRRSPLSIGLTLLITVALWITIDLDHPRVGMMQVDDAPLESLRFDSPGPH